jgi:Uma2 family endonuclease
MSIPAAPAPGNQTTRRSAIVIEERASIPAWVDDLESFRRWTRSEDFPERGRFSYLHGDLWADLSMEEFFSHNQVKAAFSLALLALLQRRPLGRFVPDRMLFTNTAADLSTEPDGLFFTWETVQSGRLKLVENPDAEHLEPEGTPDIVLEIVSRSTVRKDTVRLRELYWQAGIPEYWLVDCRGESRRFDILKQGPSGYVATEPEEGWRFSAVLAEAFQITERTDPHGHPQFVLAAREASSKP